MIRRPMLYAVCGTAAAVMLSYYAGRAAALAGVLLMAAGLLLLDKSSGSCGRWKSIVLIVLVFYCLGTAAFWQKDSSLSEEAASLNGNSLHGEITDCAYKTNQSGEPYLQLIVKSTRSTAANSAEKTPEGKVIARCNNALIERSHDADQNAKALEGRMVDISGNLQEPSEKRNPGCFDYSLYLRSLGITKTVFCDNITVRPRRSFRDAPLAYIRSRICECRETFIYRLGVNTDPGTAAMMRAILFGDKGELDEETLELFQKNGTAHILAVSGLHIGIIYTFILKLWRGRRGWLFFGFNLMFFLMYAAAAGFAPSVTRAVVMVLLHILAGIRGWRYDLSNAAFAVGLIIILQNPYMLFNTGFQMSFLAVLTLVLVLPYIKRVYAGIFLASLAVQIGLGPYILYQFNYLSLLAVLINVPVVLLAGLIVPAGLVSMACGAAGSPVCESSDEVVRILCGLLQELNTAGQMGGMASIRTPSPPLWALAAYYLGLLLFATEEGRLAVMRAEYKGRYALRMLLVVAVFSAGFHAFASDGFGKCDLIFVDVGQGDCMHLRIDDRRKMIKGDDVYNVLIDGGGRDSFDVGKKVLSQYLLKNGVRKIDLAIVTHLHNDHYDGIRSLCRMGMVKKLCVYEGYKVGEEQILEECGLDRDNLIYAAAGDVVTLGDASFTMLAPPACSDAEYVRLAENEEDENKKSLLIRTDYHGVSVMMTGDIGEDGERDALARRSIQDLQCDILKVGHHGSKTSSCEEFLDEVHPLMAVIQVGENNMYGHPAPETLEKLAFRNVTVYRNDLQGAVGIEIRKGKPKKVRTMIKE